MKCPQCDEEMEVVVVTYTASPRCYVLDEKTGEYWARERHDEDDSEEEFWCEKCGYELVRENFDRWYALVHEL